MRPVFLLLCFGLFASLQCKKDKPSTTLPEATQQGLNTIGFVVNDMVWRPFSKCGMSSDPCGEIGVRYGLQNGENDSTILLMSIREVNSKYSSLILYSHPKFLMGYTSTITTTGNKIDSLDIAFRSGRDNEEYDVTNPGSEFVVTKIDPVDRIISGNFNLILGQDKPNGKTIELKDGRFDLKLDACICR